MKTFRIILFIAILALAGVVIGNLVVNRNETRFRSTLSPAFQLMGKSTRSLNTALNRVMPVGQMDEAAYGNTIRMYYMSWADTADARYIYLNHLIKDISVFAQKKFDYQVFVSNTPVPNAYAMPGGVIVVTQGMLDLVQTEAELVSVLGHEMGHIEREHCFNAVKYELLMKKVDAKPLGQLADMISQILLRHSYNKTQENEADEYGYSLLKATSYDPSGSYQAFKHLYEYDHGGDVKRSEKKADLLSDYFHSHPPTELRAEKFFKDSQVWWKLHEGEKRYKGAKNLKELLPFSRKAFDDEWTD